MSPTPEPVHLAVDGQRLDGTLFRRRCAAHRHPAVLFVHGWGGSERQYLARARLLAGVGCTCVTFDLRGHAATRHQHERVSRADNLRDVLAVYDFLAAQPEVDPDRVGLVGSSYGGYLGAVLTAERPVRWLALRAPALYKDPGWDKPKRSLHEDPDLVAYRRRPVPPEDNLALRCCAAFRGDVLLVESEHDHVVPSQVLANYQAACRVARSVTHRVIAGADHGLGEVAWRRAYTRVLLDWFLARLGEDAPESLRACLAAAARARGRIARAQAAG